MRKNLRYGLEIVFLVFVIALSVVIFLNRERFEDLGTVGYLGLFALCFLANATVLVPSPSLLIAATCALVMNPVAVAAVASLGSSCGELVGYTFGVVTKDLSPRFRKLMDWLTGKVKNETFLVFLLALLPLPLFDFVGIYSGGTKMNLVKFSLACYAGKFLKTLFYTRMFDILAWASAVSGIALPIPIR